MVLLSLSFPHSKSADVPSFSAGELVPKCSLERPGIQGPERRVVPAVDPVASGLLIHFGRTHPQVLFHLPLLPSQQPHFRAALPTPLPWNPQALPTSYPKAHTHALAPVSGLPFPDTSVRYYLRGTSLRGGNLLSQGKAADSQVDKE